MELTREADTYTISDVPPYENQLNRLCEEIGIGGAFRTPIHYQESYNVLGYGHYAHKGRMLGALVVPHEVRAILPEPHAGLACWEAGENTYFYTDTDEHTVEAAKRRFNFNYSPVKTMLHKLQKDAATSGYSVNVWTPRQAARAVAETLPKKIMLYTGAGMSVADESVWSYRQYAEELGFSEKIDKKSTDQNMIFARQFMSQEGAVERCLSKLQILQNQIEHAEPTLAHEAFTTIVRKLGNIPLCATTNFDWLHQRAGLDVPYLTIQKGIPKAKLDEWKQFDDAFARRKHQIELILTFGRSNDARNVLHEIRAANPDVRCIAFDTNRQLSYLGPHDVVVPGDCQRTVPELAKYIP
jgi:hypothetical protein